MKKTRLVALVALVVVCIAGWAILGLNTMNDVKTQQNTVEAAQYYRGKKLFQLSLQNYQRRCTMSIWQPARNIMRTARREMCAIPKNRPMRRRLRHTRSAPITGKSMRQSIMKTAITTRWSMC